MTKLKTKTTLNKIAGVIFSLLLFTCLCLAGLSGYKYMAEWDRSERAEKARELVAKACEVPGVPTPDKAHGSNPDEVKVTAKPVVGEVSGESVVSFTPPSRERAYYSHTISVSTRKGEIKPELLEVKNRFMNECGYTIVKATTVFDEDGILEYWEFYFTVD